MHRLVSPRTPAPNARCSLGLGHATQTDLAEGTSSQACVVGEVNILESAPPSYGLTLGAGNPDIDGGCNSCYAYALVGG